MDTAQSWDKKWEEVYQSKAWGKYPPEECVRFMARHYYGAPDRSQVQVLDLGCGTGAVSWFVAREGFTVSGIDGSETAIQLAKKRFAEEGLQGTFQVGDFVSLPYGPSTFDAVIDNASIQHNAEGNIQKIVGEVFRVLKPGGNFFGMLIAENNGFFTWDGVIHYFTIDEIKALFSAFSSVSIEYVTRTENNQSAEVKFWIVEATK